MEVLNDILGYKNRKIFQDDHYFSFSLDSIMLANFVNIRYRDKNILDLGTGNAIIPLVLSLRTDKKIVGIDIQEKLVSLAKKSIQYNQLENQIEIINIDMKKFAQQSDSLFDIIICNPPYFKINEGNTINLSKAKAIARHELTITLSDVFRVSKQLLKYHGTFALVHRPERLLEILNLFRENDIEPKRLQFVYETVDKESTLVLIEGTKSGNPGLKIENPIILYEKDGQKTEQYEKLIREARQ